MRRCVFRASLPSVLRHKNSVRENRERRQGRAEQISFLPYFLMPLLTRHLSDQTSFFPPALIACIQQSAISFTSICTQPPQLDSRSLDRSLPSRRQLQQQLLSSLAPCICPRNQTPAPRVPIPEVFTTARTRPLRARFCTSRHHHHRRESCGSPALTRDTWKVLQPNFYSIDENHAPRELTRASGRMGRPAPIGTAFLSQVSPIFC